MKKTIVIIVILLITAQISYANMSIIKHQDDVPVWDVGDSWTYTIDDFSITVDNENISAEIHLIFDDILLEVIESVDDLYDISLSTDISGDFSFIYQTAGLNISGNFNEKKATHLNGIIKQSKSNLGIKNADFSSLAYLKIKINENPIFPISLPAISIPLDTHINIDCTQPFSLVQFPIETLTVWGIDQNSIQITGTIDSVWFKIINFINTLLSKLAIELLPSEIANLLPTIAIENLLELLGIPNSINIPEIGIAFICLSEEQVTVPAGTYSAYNITFGLPESEFEYARIYYSPIVGKIIKMKVFTSKISSISDITIELI